MWSGLLGLMLARLVILSGILLGLALLLPGDSVAFYAFMALAYTISIPYALWLRSQKSLASVVPMPVITSFSGSSSGATTVRGRKRIFTCCVAS